MAKFDIFYYIEKFNTSSSSNRLLFLYLRDFNTVKNKMRKSLRSVLSFIYYI